MNKKTMQNLIIRTSRGEYCPVKIDDILFLESVKGRTKIYLMNGDLHVNYSIPNIIEKLGEQFVQCHRKYTVNIEKVTSFNKSELKIDQTIISLGPKYKQTFFESMLVERTLI